MLLIKFYISFVYHQVHFSRLQYFYRRNFSEINFSAY